MTDLTIKSGSTAPALTISLFDGTLPLDLTGATVRMRMRLASGGPLVIDAPAVVDGDPELGKVRYDWQPADTDDVGRYEAEWEVTYAGGETQVFPSSGYTTVTIEPSLTAATPSLPALPDACWPVDTGCCNDFDNYPPDVQDRAKALAGQTMRMLTGYTVGGCPVLLRPCSRPCVNGSAYWYYGGGTFHPYLTGRGEWVNACGSGNCEPTSVIDLGPRVGEVVEVKIDGDILPETAYRLDNGTHLVRVDGDVWPTRQNMDLADTEDDTFSVSIRRGAPVDGLGAYAAGLLACEYAKACTNNGKCALPKGVTSVVRQGITMELNTGLFPNGLTTIREVDVYVMRYNPHGLRQQSAVLSFDIPTGRVY